MRKNNVIGYDVASLFGMLHILKKAMNIDNYMEWISKTYPQINFTFLFEGYKYYLISTIKILINVIDWNSAINIERDMIFYRINFHGVKINNAPNTCDRIIFFKNLSRIIGLMRGAKNIVQLKNAIAKLQEVLIEPSDRILKNKIQINMKLVSSKEEAVSKSAIFCNWIYLTDTHRGKPNASFVSFLDNSWDKSTKNLLDGYKYALQYIWFILLEDSFHSTSAKDIHLANRWSRSHDDQTRIVDLDSFWSKLREEIIDKDKVILLPGINDRNIMYTKKKFTKRDFPKLFEPVKEPVLNINQKLDQFFLWYSIEVLDTAKSHLFNGVLAFNTMLWGAVEIKKVYSPGEKVIVRRVKHPINAKQNEYSYAILNQAHGMFSDYSGWILFIDCCNDYSGMGGSEHDEAEKVISILLKKNLIEIQELTVPINEFNKYIQRNTVNPRHYLEAKNRDLKQVISDARGLLLELIAYYIKSKEDNIKVEWNYSEDKKQLDVFTEDKNSFHLIECKIQPNNLDFKKECKKVLGKLTAIKTNKKKQAEFWFWYEPSENVKEDIREYGLQYKVLDQLLLTNPNLKAKDMDKVKSVFNLGRYYK